jgi:hypothetical protein
MVGMSTWEALTSDLTCNFHDILAGNSVGIGGIVRESRRCSRRGIRLEGWPASSTCALLLLFLILVHNEVSSCCPGMSRCSPLQQADPLASFCGSISSSGMLLSPFFYACSVCTRVGVSLFERRFAVCRRQIRNCH